VIAPVTTIVGLGLLEYGFPGVCAHLRSFPFSLASVPESLFCGCGFRALKFSVEVAFLKCLQG
jgi:hypothetical protein